MKQHRLRGIVIEPLRDLFEGLQQNYSDQQQVVCINRAIHTSAKRLPLYRIRRDATDVPDWAHAIASFDKNVIDQHRDKIKNYDQLLVAEEVECISFDELIEQYKISKIDLLQIDTEGYDYEIIKMVDFNKLKPNIIRYEHRNLSEEDYISSLNYLAKNGYKLYVQRSDTLAYLI